MRAALEIARAALDGGDVPVGAVVLGPSGTVIGTGHNVRESAADPTGHAEVIQVTYDPKEIAFEYLLRVFWRTHDPTTLNRQGHDVGTQYRSAVFYHNDKQREIAEAYKKQLDESDTFGAPIVTEITMFEKFYPAEQYHQEYYDLNPNQGYCQAIIRPKVEKFKKEFGDLIETE